MSAAVYDLFLTHNWAKDSLGRSNHERVVAVCRALTTRGIRCWIDEVEMQGDIQQVMCKGIDESQMALCFITQEYILKVSGDGPRGKRDNCYFEFNYLYNSGKPLLAVVMEPSCRNTSTWKGKVGATLGSELFFDLADTSIHSFSGGAAFEKKMDELSETVRKLLPKLVGIQALGARQASSQAIAGTSPAPVTAVPTAAASSSVSGFCLVHPDVSTVGGVWLCMSAVECYRCKEEWMRKQKPASAQAPPPPKTAPSSPPTATTSKPSTGYTGFKPGGPFTSGAAGPARPKTPATVVPITRNNSNVASVVSKQPLQPLTKGFSKRGFVQSATKHATKSGACDFKTDGVAIHLAWGKHRCTVAALKAAGYNIPAGYEEFLTKLDQDPSKLNEKVKTSNSLHVSVNKCILCLLCLPCLLIP
jgi:hypothetical protein